MRLIDEIYLELPFYDSRRIPDELATSVSGSTGSNASDSFAQWASMQSTRKTRTMVRQPLHAVYPYPLLGLVITQPNQVWPQTSFLFLWSMGLSI